MNERVLLTAAEGIHAGNPTVPQTFAVAALFSGDPPPLGVLRERVAARWGAVHRLRRVLPVTHPRLGLGRQWWNVLDHFDPGKHVITSGDDCDLTDLLGATVSRPLSGDLPPWRLQVVHHVGHNGFALVMTVHHALMDGASAQTLLNRLLDGPSPAEENMPPAPGGGPGAARRPAPNGATGAAHTALGLLRPSKRVPVDSPRARPQVAWRPLDAGVFAAARSALPGQGMTRTEMVLAAAAGALRAVYGPPERWPGRLPAPLYAGVPVSTRSDPEELGNILSGLRVPLPVATARPHARLAACRGMVDALRAEHPQIGTRLLDTAGRLGPPALRVLAALQPHIAPVGCTSIRWKQGPWSLDGRPLTRVIVVPTLSVPGTCYFIVTEYADTLTLCVGGNAPAGHAHLLAASFERELTVLTPQENLSVQRRSIPRGLP